MYVSTDNMRKYSTEYYSALKMEKIFPAWSLAKCTEHCAKLNKLDTEKIHDLGYILTQNISVRMAASRDWRGRMRSGLKAIPFRWARGLHPGCLMTRWLSAAGTAGLCIWPWPREAILGVLPTYKETVMAALTTSLWQLFQNVHTHPSQYCIAQLKYIHVCQLHLNKPQKHTGLENRS